MCLQIIKIGLHIIVVQHLPSLNTFFIILLYSVSREMWRVFIYLVNLNFADEATELDPVSILNIRYTITGDRNLGAHSPVTKELADPESETEPLTFRSALVLHRPVLDPCFAVGFLPLPSSGLRVGQLVTMNWRVERLKDSDNNAASDALVRYFTYFSVLQDSL